MAYTLVGITLENRNIKGSVQLAIIDHQSKYRILTDGGVSGHNSFRPKNI